MAGEDASAVPPLPLTRQLGMVTIYGAGIAGLTAAHELAVRGFYDEHRDSGVLHIRVPPSPRFADQSRRRKNADALRTYLTGASPWGPRLEPARVVVLEEEDSRELGKWMGIAPEPLEDREGLLLEVVHVLPGEHGFRFFPSYYRHLFSTLVETPILDDQGRPTGRRVYDNLVPSSFYGIAAQGRRIRFLRRAPSTRPVEVLEELRTLADSGYPACASGGT